MSETKLDDFIIKGFRTIVFIFIVSSQDWTRNLQMIVSFEA